MQSPQRLSREAHLLPTPALDQSALAVYAWHRVFQTQALLPASNYTGTGIDPPTVFAAYIPRSRRANRSFNEPLAFYLVARVFQHRNARSINTASAQSGREAYWESPCQFEMAGGQDQQTPSYISVVAPFAIYLLLKLFLHPFCSPWASFLSVFRPRFALKLPPASHVLATDSPC